MAKVPPFSELIAATTRSAVHLETRDAYTPDDERFTRWLAGHPGPVPANSACVSAGEDVWWLPRRRATDICVLLNDFWVFDGCMVRFGYFAGNGEFLEDELTDDPAVARICAQAFEAVWERAIPHADYRPA
jgi:hypothetical protein